MNHALGGVRIFDSADHPKTDKTLTLSHLRLCFDLLTRNISGCYA